MNIKDLNKLTKEIRATCIKMSHDAKHGHLKSALTSCKILVILYWHYLNIEPDLIKDQSRDRFYMSKGHGVSALYAVLAKKGLISKNSLKTYCITNSKLPDHPCKNSLKILESSSGSLGHCLSIATGSLYGLKLKNIYPKSVVLMSDGECNEGSVWEAAMFASRMKLNNLLAIVDYNGLQAVGNSSEIMGSTFLDEKFRSFGWNSVTIDGENISEYIDVLKLFKKDKVRPKVIIAKTKTGISFMNNNNLWHYKVPSDAEMLLAFKELESKPIYK